MEKKLKITDTTIRDAQQSIWAKNLKTSEIIPILKDLDECEFEALEVLGGGTFETALRIWKESPWERLKNIKKNIKKTPLQMTIRGKNLVGYHFYSDEIIEEFIKKAIDCGISIIRIFDPLNDIENIQSIIKFSKKQGVKVQGAICYTISPEYTDKFFVDYAKQLKKAGVDSISLKDSAGLLDPQTAVNLIQKIQKATELDVNLHIHITNGIANITLFEAIKAGVDGIDCTMGPLSYPSSQPSTENILRLFNINSDKILEVSEKFADICLKKEFSKPCIPLNTQNIFETQLTRVSFSFLYEQLKQRNALDKLSAVLKEIKEVRNDLGNPPMIIPISQLVIAQAVYNILMAQKYKLIPREIQDYIKGSYGNPIGEINPELKKLVKTEKNIVEQDKENKKNKQTGKKDFDLIKTEIPQEYIVDETDYITYALFPTLAMDFFKYRKDPSVLDNKEKKETTISTEEEIMLLNKVMTQKGIVEFEMNQDEHYISIKKFSNEQSCGNMYISAPIAKQQTAKQQTIEKETPVASETIKTPIVGVFYSRPKPDADVYVKVGDIVNEGDTVCIIEAMKVMNEIKAPYTCKITKILVKEKDGVAPNQDLFAVEKI